MEVSSYSDQGATYLVDLYRQTCTCPDFAKRRMSAPQGDLGRACKHLVDQVRSDPHLSAQLGEAERVVLGQGHGTKLTYYHARTEAGGDLWVGVDPEYEWADVFFRKYRKGDPLGGPTGDWERFGLNLVQWSWSYGEGPRGAREIKNILERFRVRPDEGRSRRGAGPSTPTEGAGCAVAILLAPFVLLPLLFVVVVIVGLLAG